MTKKEQAMEAFPSMIPISSAEEIPRDQYVVYLLFYDEEPIVVGHGKYSRARVIFDDRETITPSHIKALFVRIYHLFGGQGNFDRLLLPCASKQEASKLEREIHASIGGNTRALPEELTAAVFEGIEEGSVEEMVLKIALSSSFDGLSDLKRWKRKGIVGEEIWSVIARKLALQW